MPVDWKMSWTTEQFLAYLARHQNRREGHTSHVIDEDAKVEFTIKDSSDEAKLNKLERAYLCYLRSLKPAWIGIQNISLKLAADTRYTPDLWCLLDSQLSAREIKGFMRDDARVKLMVAARQFPWISFILVTSKNGAWIHTEVKP